jgi:hypothetical protein
MATTITIGSVSGLPGPENATGIDNAARFVSGKTADHTTIVYKVASASYDTWTIALTGLTTSQKNALQTYFDDTAAGPTNAFSYVHTDGTTYTNCRFVDTSLRWQRRNDDEWDVTIRIEKAARINS